MSILKSAPRIEGLNVKNALALAARLRERADGLPQDAKDVSTDEDEPLHVMQCQYAEYSCGTVGCIRGEFGIWKHGSPKLNENGLEDAFSEFIGVASEYESERGEGLIIYLGKWISPAHRERFLATPMLAERLRVMASYLTWLAGAEA